MNVTGEQRGDVYVLRFFDEVVISKLPSIREKVDEFELDNAKKVLIDLEKVTFFDSSGLGYLVILMKRIKGNDGKVAICSPSELVMKLLKMIKIDKYVRIFPDQESAIEYLNSPSSEEEEVAKTS